MTQLLNLRNKFRWWCSSKLLEEKKVDGTLRTYDKEKEKKGFNGGGSEGHGGGVGVGIWEWLRRGRER